MRKPINYHIMNSPLETIEYLARSEHRIEVLEAICSAPRTREDIRDIADASRVTVGRIIADLEEREWIVRTGRQYEVTPLGAYLTAEFSRLLENIESFDRLPPIVEWLPREQPTFDLSHLSDATVITAEEGDLIAPIRRALELIAQADHLRTVANSASCEFTAAIREAVEAGQTHSLVITPETVDAIRNDADLRADIVAILGSGRTTLLQYDGEVSLPVLQIGDETVALCSGDHQTMIETDNEAVYDWADSYFASLRAQSTPVRAGSFDEDAVVVEDEAYPE